MSGLAKAERLRRMGENQSRLLVNRVNCFVITPSWEAASGHVLDCGYPGEVDYDFLKLLNGLNL